MSKFVVKRQFPLDFLGKDWKGCFLTLKSISVAEMRALNKAKLTEKETSVIIDESIKILKDHFITGTGFDSDKNEMVKLNKDDIEELPAGVVERAILFLVGDFSSASS